ncbi:YgiT-type zinc finger protein [Synechococcales cyanobacterium C]|uniref:YgiT-type zinc finger protein n=1 Tax=Petrachloros mirabilis ULC683 TaxID=2781853 RepID=A0A8K2A8A6_9CYAN|nr:YgiT-type zinc finger protein [Petrachloros mirabilis ULC683]
MFKCHVCSSETSHPENISEVFQIDGKFYLVENIPATVCSQCGEIIFSRQTTERIRVMLHSKSHPIRAISMDVYAY